MTVASYLVVMMTGRNYRDYGNYVVVRGYLVMRRVCDLCHGNGYVAY